jgi:hypothetical protein
MPAHRDVMWVIPMNDKMNAFPVGVDGRVTDLNVISAADIDFPEIAQALAKIARWNGRHKGDPFSVAQHCIEGAERIETMTGEALVAAAFLLHDAHEAYLGDIVTPAARLIDLHCPGAEMAITRAKAKIDAAIYTAAGLPWPLPPYVVDLVRRVDLSMRDLEYDDLYNNGDKFARMPWRSAERNWLKALMRLRARLAMAKTGQEMDHA